MKVKIEISQSDAIEILRALAHEAETLEKIKSPKAKAQVNRIVYLARKINNAWKDELLKSK